MKPNKELKTGKYKKKEKIKKKIFVPLLQII